MYQYFAIVSAIIVILLIVINVRSEKIIRRSLIGMYLARESIEDVLKHKRAYPPMSLEDVEDHLREADERIAKIIAARSKARRASAISLTMLLVVFCYCLHYMN